jgi:hypothetical protein
VKLIPAETTATMRSSWLVFLGALLIAALAAPAAALESGETTVQPGRVPLFGRDRLRNFVLDNYDRFARIGQPLPALREDALNFVSQSFRPEQVTRILASFNELFPGIHDPDTENTIEIIDADHISAAIADKVMPVRADVARDIRKGIEDGTLCWSGKIPTDVGDVPFVLVSQQADGTELSNCLYRGVLAHMGVTVLYKDRYPMEGRLNAVLSHMANITAMHVFFECRKPIRELDFASGRSCVEQRFDELY